MRLLHAFSSLAVFFLTVSLFIFCNSYSFAFELDEDGNHHNIESLAKGIFWDSPRGMHLYNNILFISTDSSGISFVDISEPTNPVRINHFDPHRTVAGFSGMSGFYHYFTESNQDRYNLKVLNVADPLNPVLYHEMDVDYSGPIKKIDRYGNTLYVLHSDSLAIVHVTVPDHEDSLLTTFVSDAGINDFALVENRIFIADGAEGLKIFNANSPASLELAGAIGLTGNSNIISIRDNLVVIGTDDSSLHLVDVNNTTSPTLLSTFILDEIPVLITISETELFVTDISNQLHIIDIADTTTPNELGLYQVTGNVCKTEHSGNSIYLLDDNSGLISLDISIPSNPTENWTFGSYGRFSDAIISEQTVFISDLREGLRILDISDSTNIIPLSEFHFEGISYDLELDGTNLYFLNSLSGLNIFDVSNTSQPNLLWSQNSVTYFTEIVVEEGLAYILKNQPGQYSWLNIYDISDPVRPVRIEEYNINTYCSGIKIIDGFAYLLINGVLVLDISDPTDPEEIFRGEAGSNFDYYDIDAYENFVVKVGDLNTSVNVLWNTLPGTRYFTYPIPDNRGIHIENGYLFCTCMHDGLKIFNIGNPFDPLILGYYDTYFYAYDLSIDNGKVFVHNNYYYELFDYSPSLAVDQPDTFNLILPENEAIVQNDGAIEIAWEASSNDVTGYIVWVARNSQFTREFRRIETSETNYVLEDLSTNFNFYWKVKALNDSSSGTWSNETWRFTTCNVNDVEPKEILDLPDSYELSKVYPNPFNPTLNVEVALPESGNLSLAVYNLLGKEVAVLNQNQLSAGYHSFVFDGTSLSSGVYFIQASVPGKLETIRKVVLMK